MFRTTRRANLQLLGVVSVLSMVTSILVFPNYAHSVTVPSIPIQVKAESSKPIVLNDESVRALIAAAPLVNRLSPEKREEVFQTLKGEAGQYRDGTWKNGQSEIPNVKGPNGFEDSWGIAMIHTPAHPNITRAQQLDPVFSVNWTVKQFVLGNEWMWTWWKDHYGEV